jgi:hypothetical protein
MPVQARKAGSKCGAAKVVARRSHCPLRLGIGKLVLRKGDLDRPGSRAGLPLHEDVNPGVRGIRGG